MMNVDLSDNKRTDVYTDYLFKFLTKIRNSWLLRRGAKLPQVDHYQHYFTRQAGLSGPQQVQPIKNRK